MLRSKDECFENVEVCPLCSSSMVYYFLERLVISIFRCKECGFGFQNPRVKYSVVKEIYKDEKKKYTKEEFKEFLEETLVQKHDCPPKLAPEMSENIIENKGRKTKSHKEKTKKEKKVVDGAK